jgi:hypothetical protein
VRFGRAEWLAVTVIVRGGIATVKRHAIALGAGLLLLWMLPGSVLAYTTSNMDQKNTPSSTDHSVSGSFGLAQTFTAGKTGVLVEVGLWMMAQGATTATIDITAIDGTTGFPTGASLAMSTATVPDGGNWVYFSFNPPLGVTSGTKYAIVIGNDDSYLVVASAENYSRGEALGSTVQHTVLSSVDSNLAGWELLSSTDSNLADLAFVTFVDTAAPKLAWDKTSVQAGVSTPLTLTETVTFKNGPETWRYNAQLTNALPGWFHITGIACSDTAAEIAPADCTVARFKTGFGDHIDAIIGGDVVTITLTGTADPAAADVGAASVSAEGCLLYQVKGDQPDGSCASAAARITVTAAVPTPTPTPTAAPTPPPTTTTSGSSSDGSGVLWFLPIGLIGALGGLLAIATRTRRRIA